MFMNIQIKKSINLLLLKEEIKSIFRDFNVRITQNHLGINQVSELEEIKENHLRASTVFKPGTDKMDVTQFEMSYKNCLLSPKICRSWIHY